MVAGPMGHMHPCSECEISRYAELMHSQNVTFGTRAFRVLVYITHLIAYYNFSCCHLLLYIPAHHRSDAKGKDLLRQLDEEKTTAQRNLDQVNQLNAKLKGLRRDKEDAEGEVETFQKKLKQAKAQIEDAEETSTMLQVQITKMRAAARRPKVS